MGRQRKKKYKNGILKLNSDCDFLQAFEKNEADTDSKNQETQSKDLETLQTDRHGLPVLDSNVSRVSTELDGGAAEDFKTLLEQSFAAHSGKPKVKPKPVPLKKRLKRYPPIQKTLDLHGCTAVQAQVKTRSFLLTGKQQGLFTVRIIVGKGRHSQMGPVLPDVIEDLVIALKKSGQVLWFEWEKKTKARSGALVVYLKQFEQYD